MTTKGGNAQFMKLRAILCSNPELSVSGSVENRQRYTYSTAPDLIIQVEGYLANGEEGDADQALGSLVNEVQEQMEEWAHDFNSKMEQQLYQELEYRQSEEALSETWDASEIVFDEEGNMVTQVEGGRRVRTGVRFSELSPEAKEHALDHYRNWDTDDSSWAEYLEGDFEKQLESFGFDRVDIQYSLGYSQGDGACFTAGTIDVKKFLDQMVSGRRPEDVFSEAHAAGRHVEARRLAEELLA